MSESGFEQLVIQSRHLKFIITLVVKMSIINTKKMVSSFLGIIFFIFAIKMILAFVARLRRRHKAQVSGTTRIFFGIFSRRDFCIDDVVFRPTFVRYACPHRDL